MEASQTLHREQAGLLVIDLQTKLLPHIDAEHTVRATAAALIETAALFDLPVTTTVQYVQGLGPTHADLATLLAERKIEPIEKAAFSVCGDTTARATVEAMERKQIVVTGIESHVCVLQTVLDLIAMGMTPFVCADAVSSRRALDREHALARMARAGAVVTTTEAVLFELCEISGTPAFKRMLDILKRLDRARGKG